MIIVDFKRFRRFKEASQEAQEAPQETLRRPPRRPPGGSPGRPPTQEQPHGPHISHMKNPARNSRVATCRAVSFHVASRRVVPRRAVLSPTNLINHGRQINNLDLINLINLI